MLPRGSAPRVLEPPVSSNLVTRPRDWRGVDLTPFEQLRALAAYDLVRVVIQDVKGQVEGMEFDVVPEEGVEVTPAVENQIQEAKAWLGMPDPLRGLTWRGWLASVLEEVLVTDALTLYPRIDRARRPIGLQQIDGATIKPLVDDLGQPPLPPNPAYQQIIHGQVETWFNLGELWYLPRHRRPNTPYGRSPVEMVLVTVNLALRAQIHDLAFYTEGTLPEGLYAVPEGWDNDRIVAFQEHFDSVRAGRDDRRSGYLAMVPPGTYTAIKDREWAYEFKEWMSRIICWAFGVSPMPVAKTPNRAIGEVLEVSTMESGVRPLAEFIAEIATAYLKGPLGYRDLKCAIGSDEVEDAKMVSQRNVSYFRNAGLTLNEYLAATGSKSIEGDDGDLRMIETPSGLMVLQDFLKQRKMREAALEAQSRIPGEGKKPIEPKDAPSDEKQLEEEEEREAEKKVAAELTMWRNFALRRIREGRPLRKFQVERLPAALVRRVEAGLRRAGRNEEKVRKVFQAALVGKYAEEPPEALAAPTKKIEDLFAAWLAAKTEEIVAAAVAELPEKPEKEAA